MEKNALLHISYLLLIFVLFPSLANAQNSIESIQEKLLTYESTDKDSTVFYRNKLALIFRNKSQYELSKKEFIKCATTYSEMGKDSLESVIYNNLGEVYMLMAKFDSALYYHNQALDIRLKRDNVYGQGVSNLNMGNVYLYKSSYDTALIFYNKSITHFDQIKDSLRLASVYNNIGAIHSFIGNTDQVVNYWEKSLDLKEALNDERAIAISKNNLAELYISQNKLDLAEEYLIDAIEIKERSENVESLMTSYFNLSEVYKLQEKSSLSLSLLKKAEAKLQNSSSAYLKAELNNKLGNYYATKGDTKQAEKYLLNAIKNAEGGKVNEIHLSALESMAELYKNAGSYRKAYQYSTTFHSLKDSLLGESQQEKILDLETKYDVQSKAQKIQLLQADKKFQQAQNDRNKQRILYLILGLSLLLLSTILLWRNVRLKRKNNLLLQEKNKEISYDLETKNFLFKEIQHRIKNNLSVVDSLINLQSIQNSEADPKEVLTNAQNRIRSISLLYDLLYSDTNFQELTLSSYIEELSNQLESSLGFRSKKIQVIKQLSDVKLPKDFFINIGLILNELLTNARKHGFTDDGGKIYINLKNETVPSLEVYHTGNQFKEEKLAKSNGLGMQLIKGLSQQINSKLTIEEETFTKFIISFPHE